MRFCHMDIEWCWFEEELQASQRHGRDPLTGPLCLCGRGFLKLDQPWSGGVKIKDGLCFVENGVQGCITLEGTERAIYEYTWLVHLSSPQPS